MIEVKDILGKARQLGACSQSGKATDWKSLAWLFFSPQGREFCKDNNFPSLELFRQIKSKAETYGVYIEDDIKVINKDAAIIAGTAELIYHGPTKAYKVIIMHGASIKIKVGSYAVVRVENMGGTYEVINDGTGTILQ